MPLRICFIASEAVPLAKTGGLADVAGALTRCLHAAGHDARLFMPLYGQIDRRGLEFAPAGMLRGLSVTLGGRTIPFDILTARLPASPAPIHLVDAPALYARPQLYTADADEHLRFILLTHAALLGCQRLGFAPQVVHCNDWHTGLAPLLL